MALVDGSETSFDRDYVTEVIHNAIDESDEDVPDLDDEFWEPVTNSTTNPSENDSRITNKLMTMDMEQEIRVLRRSHSADRQSDTDESDEKEPAKEKFDGEYCRKYEGESKDIDSQPPSQHNISDDEVNADDETESISDLGDFEYLREYEQRIDDLERSDFALGRAIFLLKAQVEEIYKHNFFSSPVDPTADDCKGEISTSEKETGDDGTETEKQRDLDAGAQFLSKDVESTEGGSTEAGEDKEGTKEAGNEGSDVQDGDTAKDDCKVKKPRIILKEIVAEMEARLEHFVNQVGGKTVKEISHFSKNEISFT